MLILMLQLAARKFRYYFAFYESWLKTSTRTTNIKPTYTGRCIYVIDFFFFCPIL